MLNALRLGDDAVIWSGNGAIPPRQTEFQDSYLVMVLFFLLLLLLSGTYSILLSGIVGYSQRTAHNNLLSPAAIEQPI